MTDLIYDDLENGYERLTYNAFYLIEELKSVQDELLKINKIGKSNSKEGLKETLDFMQDQFLCMKNRIYYNHMIREKKRLPPFLKIKSF